MTADEILIWFPPNPLHRTINAADTFSKVRLVTSQQIASDSIAFNDLPTEIREPLLIETHLTGFNLPDVEQAFIKLHGVSVPNRAHADRFPLLVSEDRDILDLLSGDFHWVWFGTARRTAWQALRPGRTSFAPQTNYRGAAGIWRRMATSSLLLGRGWQSQCDGCGNFCLRPDHWHQPALHGLAPGLGPGRVADYGRILHGPTTETETQPETQPETETE